MLAFKVESWIWYSVVLLVAISRLYDSHVRSICTTIQPRKPESKFPSQLFKYQAQMQKH
jgi:hypothetical protein